MTHKAKELTTEEAQAEHHSYRELLIKNSIKENIKDFNDPVDFLMYLLNDVAMLDHDINGEDTYTSLYGDNDMKLDYILDHLTMYKNHHRLFNKKSTTSAVDMLDFIRAKKNVK